jgi:hypothetical protein
MTTPKTPRWFKSSYSGGSGTECVECARLAPSILVRDSKRDGGPELTFRYSAWQAFTDAVRHHEMEDHRGYK